MATVQVDSKTRAAIIEKDKAILLNRKNVKDSLISTGEIEEEVELDSLSFLPPIPEPQKIICIGHNYVEHIKERIATTDPSIPKKPLFFLKPPSALIAHEAEIILPDDPDVERVDHEAELAIVIGKRTRNISESEAAKYILGYTCFNDVTARNLQLPNTQWTRAKGYDTFGPCGPWIETKVDPSSLNIKCYVNKKIVQNSNSSRLIFPPYFVVSYLSSIMTLEPGDIISTGTPAGISKLSKNDLVEVEIEKIGLLRNRVK
ncbi:fumarylacetoacetate hydrolase family protein [Candidatus Micrarchaeota archaeon]|nr:fumarylacetoacetate hydrolase family protein [Candidatus Micrarchaeota archaeon]